MSFSTIHSETVFEGRVFDVRTDQVRMPDGRVVRLDVVSHRGAVTIIPVDDEGQVWFIRQYRHPAEKELLEFPAGVLEAGEEPVVAAQREAREEIGMRAESMQPVGQFYLAPGYSTEFMHVFLAKGLIPDPLEADEDELLSVEKAPLARAIEMAENGEIQDAKTLAALLLAKKWL